MHNNAYKFLCVLILFSHWLFTYLKHICVLVGFNDSSFERENAPQDVWKCVKNAKVTTRWGGSIVLPHHEL